MGSGLLLLRPPHPPLLLQASSWASWAWGSPSCSAPASAGRATVTGRRRWRGRRGDAPPTTASPLPYISSPSLEACRTATPRIPAGTPGTARTTSRRSTAASAAGPHLPTTRWVECHKNRDVPEYSAPKVSVYSQLGFKPEDLPPAYTEDAPAVLPLTPPPHTNEVGPQTQ